MSDDPTLAMSAEPTQPAERAQPTPARPRLDGRRRALLLVLVGLLLFGSGTVTGAGLSALFLGSRMRHAARNPGQVAAAAMTRQLNLTAQQRGQVDAILERHKSDFAAVRKQMAENYRSMADEVKAVLTPEQQRTFETMLGRMNKMGMMGGPGDRRHGPGGPRGWRPNGPPRDGRPVPPPGDGPH